MSSSSSEKPWCHRCKVAATEDGTWKTKEDSFKVGEILFCRQCWEDVVVPSSNYFASKKNISFDEAAELLWRNIRCPPNESNPTTAAKDTPATLEGVLIEGQGLAAFPRLSAG